MGLLKTAARQGHVYAMRMLGGMYTKMKAHESAVGWFTMGAEAGLPDAMCCLACCFDTGEGVAAADSSAAAGWYKRAADAGSAQGAYNLHTMYTLGRGRAWQILPASSFYTSVLLQFNPRFLI